MSAAEPAEHIPPVNAGTDASVIPISHSKRDRARTRETSQGRWTKMGSPPEPNSPDQPEHHGPDPGDVRGRLAEHLEVQFNERGQSLSDKKTATAFVLTLQIVIGMLDGALANGDVDEAQHRTLTATYKHMMDAPRRIENE
jgi:hypothetical protein